MADLTELEWRTEDRAVPYPEALAAMDARVAAIRAGSAPELAWLLEHPPLYTAGTSAKRADLLIPDKFPVYPTGRGGQYTYHGPGQRVAYLMLDLRRRRIGVHRYVCHLEEWVIRSLACLNIKGERREGRIGVWVARPDKPPRRALDGTIFPAEDKIAAIGVRVRHWVAFHGVSINVDPDLSHFEGIVPCGISEHGVTSLADLGLTAGMPDLDAALQATFDTVFTAAPEIQPSADEVVRIASTAA